MSQTSETKLSCTGLCIHKQSRRILSVTPEAACGYASAGDKGLTCEEGGGWETEALTLPCTVQASPLGLQMLGFRTY